VDTDWFLQEIEDRRLRMSRQRAGRLLASTGHREHNTRMREAHRVRGRGDGGVQLARSKLWAHLTVDSGLNQCWGAMDPDNAPHALVATS
jgi:hypothetical protein